MDIDAVLVYKSDLIALQQDWTLVYCPQIFSGIKYSTILLSDYIEFMLA